MKLYLLIKAYNKLSANEKNIVYDSLISHENICIRVCPTLRKKGETKITPQMNHDKCIKCSFKLKIYINKLNNLSSTNRILFINYVSARKLQQMTCPVDLKDSNKTICDALPKQICDTSGKTILSQRIKKTFSDVTIGLISGGIVGAIAGSILPGPGTLIGLIAGATSGGIGRPVGNIVEDAFNHQKNSISIGKAPKYTKYKFDLIKTPNDFFYPPVPDSLLKIEIIYKYNLKKILNNTNISVFISGMTKNNRDNMYVITYYKIGNLEKPYQIIQHDTTEGSNKIFNFNIYDEGKYQISILNNKKIIISEENF
jgi:outer membrane lipoprotein SlyB